MGKPKASIMRAKVEHAKKIPKGFDTERPSRSKKDKERTATLAALRRMGAPLVTQCLF